MDLSTLKIILSHLNTLKDLASQAEDLAGEEISCDDALRTIRTGLIDTIDATNPKNRLAIAMLEATHHIDDERDQASYLLAIVEHIKKVTQELIKLKLEEREKEKEEGKKVVMLADTNFNHADIQ